MPLEWRRAFFPKEKRIIYFTTFSIKNQIIFWSKPPLPFFLLTTLTILHFFDMSTKSPWNTSSMIPKTHLRENQSHHNNINTPNNHNTSKQCLKYFLHQKWHLLTKKHLVPSFQLPFQWWFSKDNSKRHSSIHFTCVDWFVIILPTSSNHRFSMFELPPTSTHSNTTIHVLSQDDHIESSFLIQITSKSFSIIPKQQMQAHLMKHVSLNSFTCIAQLSRPQIVSISVVLFW